MLPFDPTPELPAAADQNVGSECSFLESNPVSRSLSRTVDL